MTQGKYNNIVKGTLKALHKDKSIYAIEGQFNQWLKGEGKQPRTMKAVVYDQYGSSSWIVSGTREDILNQYGFYKDCYPDKILGLVCEEYFKHFKQTKNTNAKK